MFFIYLLMITKFSSPRRFSFVHEEGVTIRSNAIWVKLCQNKPLFIFFFLIWFYSLFHLPVILLFPLIFTLLMICISTPLQYVYLKWSYSHSHRFSPGKPRINFCDFPSWLGNMLALFTATDTIVSDYNDIWSKRQILNPSDFEVSPRQKQT